MRVVVFGAGGVGTFYGGLLAQAGVDVRFVARGPQLEAIRSQGITIRSHRLGEIRVPPVEADSDTRHLGPADLVLICVKTYQTVSILDDLQPLIGPRTIVVTMQNGVESDLDVAARVGAERVIPAVVYVGATLEAPGVVSHVAAGTITIGVRAGGDASRLEEVAAVLRHTGQPVRISDDVQRERWTKLLWNASFNPVSALTGRSPTDLLRKPGARALIVGLMGEVARVAAAEGVPLDEDAIEQQVTWTEGAGSIRTSMMVDRERGRALETDALVGVVVRRGRQHGIPTPFSEAMLALLES